MKTVSAQALDKFLPPPIPGSEKIIPSRHPVQIGLLLGFVAAAIFQYAEGPVVGSLGAVVPWSLWVALLGASTLGCLLCFIAAVIAKRAPWDAIGFSLGGFFILTFVLLFAVLGYVGGYEEYYAMREFWVNLFISGGFLWRFCQLSRYAARIWRFRHHAVPHPLLDQQSIGVT